MTEVAEKYLGNINQDQLLTQQVTQQKGSKSLLEVNLTESDRNKGRIFTQSTSGVAVGIVKSRDFQLKAGDVFQTNQGNLLLVNLTEETVMVLQFSEAIFADHTMNLVRLGHLLGNHHYPIKIEANKVYVRINSEAKVIISLIQELNLTGLTISWEQVSSLDGLTSHPHHH